MLTFQWMSCMLSYEFNHSISAQAEIVCCLLLYYEYYIFFWFLSKLHMLMLCISLAFWVLLCVYYSYMRLDNLLTRFILCYFRRRIELYHGIIAVLVFQCVQYLLYHDMTMLKWVAFMQFVTRRLLCYLRCAELSELSLLQYFCGMCHLNGDKFS